MPLHQMCLSGKFEWTSVHQSAWEAIKLLCSLNFQNNVVDENRTLLLACDSSQISVSWVSFQIVEGDVKLISLDSKILNGADRRKAAPFRETIALLYCLMSNENIIKSHPAKCLLLTDCIGLSQIFRSKDSSSKLMEASLYLSSFRNLHVKYSTGSSLFMADLMTREFNRVHLDDKQQKLSDIWSELHPPLDKQHLGAEISPQMLTDLLCAGPQAEYIDCFAKRKFYNQSLSRYHTSTDEVVRFSDPIPTKLEFLSSIYGGWNSTKMTQAQFQELNNSIKNLPA